MKHFNATHGEAHGKKRTKEYRAWRSIKQRCFLETDKEFKNYGARGITMCPSWINSFESFLADMGRAPSPIYSIERIDNSGNYSPENCRWTTPYFQSRNRRTNLFAEFHGVMKCAKDWAIEIKITRWTMERRLKSGKTVAEIKAEFS